MAEPTHVADLPDDRFTAPFPPVSPALPEFETARRRLVPVKIGGQRKRSDLRSILFQHEWTTGLLYLFLDTVVWLFLYNLSVYVRGSAVSSGEDPISPVFLIQLTVIAVALFIVGGYDRRTNFTSLGYMSEHLITLVAAGAIGALFIYSVTAYAQNIRPSRGVLLASLAAFAPLSLTYRRYVGNYLLTQTARSFFLVIGTGEMARRFYHSYLTSTNRQQLRFVATDPKITPESRSLDPATLDTPLLAADALDELAVLALQSQGVIVAEDPRKLTTPILDWLTRLHFARTPVYTLESFYELQWRRVPVHAIDPIWPFQMGFGLASTSPYSQVKRLFDIAAASVALVALSPLLVILALLTWLDSGRPALFRQARVGRDSQNFTIYKFRTMHSREPGAEGDPYTRSHDTRITRLGHWLRKLRLDELPQLWNVLKGDMSMIGPRAEWDRLAKEYESEIPFYHFRHLIKPGITGWAQVNYPYGASREDAVEKLKFDLYYIRHYSLRLDAMIVLKTLHIMIWGKGV